MTKEVIVTISGDHMAVQSGADDMADVIEQTMPAVYYEKNGKRYVLYEEWIDGERHALKNKLKLTGDTCLEIIKSGAAQTHMIFEKDQRHLTMYKTPMGNILLGVHTKRLDVTESDEQLDIRAEYELDMNEEPMAVCAIHVCVQASRVHEQAV